MAMYFNPRDRKVYFDADSVESILITRGYTPNQAKAAIYNHMYHDSYRYTDRRWYRNIFITFTKDLLLENSVFNEVVEEILESGIPTTYDQTGTPVKA